MVVETVLGYRVTSEQSMGSVSLCVTLHYTVHSLGALLSVSYEELCENEIDVDTCNCVCAYSVDHRT